MLKRKNGMTLIEVILSMTILAIIFIPLFSVFGTGYIGIMAMGNRTKAVEEGKKIIDIIYDEKNINNAITQADIQTIISTHNTDSDYVVSLEEYNELYNVSGLTGITMCKIRIKITYDNGRKSVYQTFLLQ